MNLKKILAQPTAFIVFGATGDLTQNKLYPALYELARRKMLPKDFTLYGLSRKKMKASTFKKDIHQDLKRYAGKKIEKKAVDLLLKKVQYIGADLNEPDGYHKLEKHIQAHEKKHNKAVLRIFYLALPPSLFDDVTKHVKTCKAGGDICSIQNVRSRVVLEKPFGYDYKTALRLDKEVKKLFDEEQIYRIDHYLGKESFQTMFAFRFANEFFEEHWDNRHIQSIQINALESIGTEGRHSYYDGAGAMRDMVQSHLMQFIAYLTMDEPKDLSAKALRKAKEQVLKHIKPSKKGVNIITGQYQGYTKDPGIIKGSKTETYIATKFEINSPRWKGVPIYVRTGKNLSHKETSAIISFKHKAPLFMKAKADANVADNRLMIQISPQPSITLQMNVDKQGFQLQTDTATMHYCRHENKTMPPIGDYERLLMDIIEGDQMLFTSSEEVLSSWKAVDPLISKIKNKKPLRYTKGTIGPKESSKILEQGEEWYSVSTHCPIK